MAGYYELPPNVAEDTAQHEEDVNRFVAGQLAPDVFRGSCGARGIYEQRRDETYFVRVRVTGGALTPDQARLLTSLSREFGNGLLHVTTRQDLQLHDVWIEDTPEIMRQLLTVGLSPKGGGGNTLRNIMACPYAGVCPNEPFDVTPFTHQMTEFMLSLPGSFTLPRKYKIAFSGCPTDCALASATDLGFIAGTRGGQCGFSIYSGGGLGARSRVGQQLLDFLPAQDAIRAAEAVRRIFERIGDRTHRARARLRFAVERIGIEAFRSSFERELDAIRTDTSVPATRVAPGSPCSDSAPIAGMPACRDDEGLAVLDQRQSGYVTVPFRLPLGQIAADDLDRLAGLAEDFSDEKGLRTTRDQNILLRFVPARRLPELRAAMTGFSSDVLGPNPVHCFTTCPGATTCRRGLCRSRELAQNTAAAFAKASLDADALTDVDIRISGCPNTCAQQILGDIGLFGTVRHKDGRKVPHYRIVAGARTGEGTTRFGSVVAQIPESAVPCFLTALLQDFRQSRSPREKLGDYVARTGADHVAELAAPFE
jgi:sulfite reductase (ferredoxin)